MICDLGFNGITHYQFVHFFDIDTDYNGIMEDVVKNNTPENFEKALWKAKEYADAHPEQKP